MAIAGWVRRHFPGKTESEVNGMVEGITNKLAAEGQKPTYFVRNQLPKLRDDTVIEVSRFLKLESGKKRK